MEEIEFKKIHNVIIQCLDEENENKLEILGSWYYHFLKSNQEKLSLYLPFYSVEFAKLAFSYIRLFTVTFNLLKQYKLIEYKGLCLFNIFDKSLQSNMDDLTLDFLKKNKNLALWKKNTLTKLNNFLPVFNKEEILQFNKPKTIRNTFDLYRSIRKSGIVDFPQYIELKEKILSFNNIDDNLDDELISENLFIVDKNLDDDYAMELERELISQELNNSITIRYPYSKKQHPYLLDIGKKRFKLIFKNRFAYNDILEDDIFLLQNEIKLSTQLVYNIVDTKHSRELYVLFKNFKEQWANLELNKYTTPFPKYWFLFLNKSLSKDDWLTQFKKDFPAVAEKPIIRIVENIINEIIKLNWIEDKITDSTKILFPELKSSRKKRLEFIYNNFKNYINTINKKVKFLSSIDSNNYNNILILDSFNIIDLVNKNQSDYKDTINIIVPDFLYFGYQPWIKYHLFNYQFTPLLRGLRKNLDINYISNKEIIEDLKNKIIKEIIDEYKIYRNKYKEERLKDVFLVEPDEIPNEEDFEFTNDEEIDNSNSERDRNIKAIIINQNLDNELAISSTEKVLLQKDTLLYVKAASLKVGDFFVRNNDISNLFKADDLYDSLVNIPNSVLNYQTKLSANNNIYQTLKHKGISYQHKKYFEDNYIKDESTFRIPRRKNDWAIICEFLNIDHSAQQLAFIAYYGRSKQNELKKMYKSIIDLLLKNNWIGTIEDPNIVTSVSQLVNQYYTIFNTTDTIEIREISESIITTILNQLKFTEISTIKIIENE